MTDCEAMDDQDPLRTNELNGGGARVDELLRLHRGALERYAYRFLGNSHEAEDVVQDSVAALLGAGRVSHTGARAWMFRAVRYRCQDLIKRRRCSSLGVDHGFGALAPPSPHTGPPTAAVRDERQESLRRHLAALRPEYAEVLALRHFEGLRRAEIAEVLDLSESTVKSRLYEASRELRQRWKEEP